MSGNPWPLIDRVRAASYDVFTMAEKQRMHDLFVRLKTKKSISLDDLAWLREMDAALQSLLRSTRRFVGGAGDKNCSHDQVMRD
jgi:hypothetical protein